jgi:DNA uptake protein ComE-like DNA-binding protein
LFGVPTANEHKALWFLAIVATSGTAVRIWRANHDGPPAVAVAELDSQLRRVDSVRAGHATAAVPSRRSQPARPSSPAPLAQADPADPVDLDRSDVGAIAGLAGLSRGMAERIVADRDSLGAFGSLEALCWRIRGVGPATIKRLRPAVTFSAAPSPVSGECGEASKPMRKTRRSAQRQSR